MWRYLISVVGAAAFGLPAFGTAQELRHHGAHEHGAAELNLVWEGAIVTIEFDSPAVNIVGFEHVPSTAAQKKAVSDAMATLRDANRLFSFTRAARCRGEVKALQSELAQTTGREQKHKKDRDEEHSQFRAEYRFTCEKPDALETVQVNLLQLFPGTHKLRAQMVSDRGQIAVDLAPGSARLTLP